MRIVQGIFGLLFLHFASLEIVKQVQVNRDPPIAYANFHKLAGQFLNATGLAGELTVQDLSGCALKCLNHHKCLSLNFGGSGGTSCKIFGLDRFSKSSSLGRDAKYDYYYIKSVCDESPCSNGGKCISGDESGNFTCECTRLYTGKTCTDPAPCQNALGMENGKIKDSQLSMSSYWNKDSRYGAKNGRLNKSDSPYGSQFDTADKNPWFKIDFLEIKYVSGVGIQGYGYPTSKARTTSFMVSTSADGSSWKMYQEIAGINKTFPGNTDVSTEARGMFKAPVAARLVQVFATSCSAVCSIRMELYGCSPYI